ncbi:uncharacterized protein (DUF302 family) [Collimonas sp. PA-H2]|uniref:DUF302 domain-containing protein n=1 Tax=Collimonas sp. PA-H2 TaxID=1881062 RepID=UPI000C01E9FB|nr:DUF302 domain-containing protein [Collimonas sp. PA-H2]PFH04628.1 uncharacterized protein (DUF302 family) [Collimonas sp. PA-H2]
MNLSIQHAFHQPYIVCKGFLDIQIEELAVLNWMRWSGSLSWNVVNFAPLLMMAGSTSAGAATSPRDPIESASAFTFSQTLERLTDAIAVSGMTLFARIDHQAAAAQVGLAMPPTTVLVYGNPQGGTPLMLEAPALALDLPLRVLVREDTDGVTQVMFHAAAALLHSVGLASDKAANLSKAEAIILNAIQSLA